MFNVHLHNVNILSMHICIMSIYCQCTFAYCQYIVNVHLHNLYRVTPSEFIWGKLQRQARSEQRVAPHFTMRLAKNTDIHYLNNMDHPRIASPILFGVLLVIASDVCPFCCLEVKNRKIIDFQTFLFSFFFLFLFLFFYFFYFIFLRREKG